MRIGFRFRAIPLVATVLLVALGISLGRWQDRRAAEKSALQAQLAERAHAEPLQVGAAPIAAADVQYRPVRVTGEFLASYPLFLDNRPVKGKTGFYLLMPLRIAHSDRYVLVARGWLPRYTAEHDRLPAFSTPRGEVSVTGIALASMGHVMQLGDAPAIAPRAILQNVVVADFAAASKLSVQPFFIEQQAAATPDDRMERDWPAPALGIDKHKGYAFQWYALAAMAVIFFLVTGFRRARHHE